jgi:hypothetical protein
LESADQDTVNAPQLPQLLEILWLPVFMGSLKVIETTVWVCGTPVAPAAGLVDTT